ncbi:hypothetical protein [Hyphobacterium sp.]|uniref:hypothetical protein n=1 Tax=Hyphobacterium sp. TaxID=2004662 RepID=UPI003BA91BAC
MINWLKSNHQAITAIGAMVVGLAALYVAWDQSRVMRAQQHGAVVPALQIDAFTNTDDGILSVGLRVANNGVGPAMIEHVRVLRDGETVDQIDAMFDSFPAEQLDRSWVTLTGRVVAPGELVIPISVAWPGEAVNAESIAALFSEWDRWETEICYCSVFDRCWIATVQVRERRQVHSCPAPSDDIFEQYGSEGFRAFTSPEVEPPQTAGAEQ